MLPKKQIEPALRYKCHIVFASRGMIGNTLGGVLGYYGLNNEKSPRGDSEKHPGERDVIACFHKGGREAVMMGSFLGERRNKGHTKPDPGAHTVSFCGYFQTSLEYKARQITESCADRVVEVCEIVIIRTHVGLQPWWGQL